MLYDPKWETTVSPATKPDILSLPTLIAWLEKQPADEEYEFDDCTGACLLGQYWAAHGIAWYSGIYQCAERGGLDVDNWGLVIAAPHPHTFGAALSRAHKLSTQAEHVGDSK